MQEEKGEREALVRQLVRRGLSPNTDGRARMLYSWADGGATLQRSLHRRPAMTTALDVRMRHAVVPALSNEETASCWSTDDETLEESEDFEEAPLTERPESPPQTRPRFSRQPGDATTAAKVAGLGMCYVSLRRDANHSMILAYCPKRARSWEVSATEEEVRALQ